LQNSKAAQNKAPIQLLCILHSKPPTRRFSLVQYFRVRPLQMKVSYYAGSSMMRTKFHNLDYRNVLSTKFRRQIRNGRTTSPEIFFRLIFLATHVGFSQNFLVAAKFVNFTCYDTGWVFKQFLTIIL
jgi:hypothetical protein